MWRTWLAWLSIGRGGMVERPLCEMQSPNTPVAGVLSQGNLMLDAGCRYRLFEKSNAASCLKGNWIAVTGSSNALLQSLNAFDHPGFHRFPQVSKVCKLPFQLNDPCHSNMALWCKVHPTNLISLYL
jgi:hypothetical protein